jgi:predicted TIM-barrel fold metal-dependent hydrolase
VTAAPGLEIVDGQVHPNRIGPQWQEAGPDVLVDATVAAMDAVGVQAALLDEYVGWTEAGGIIPGHDVDGVWRADYPVTSRAVERFPDRFAYCARVDRKDPEMADLIADLRRHPGRCSLRWCPPVEAGEWEPFAAGEYDAFFAAAQRHRVPVFLNLPNRSHTLARYARAFPDLWFVLDHCGVVFPLDTERSPRFFEPLGQVLEMARFPNVALKWCHAPRLSSLPYPFADVTPHLRRAIDAFGPERVIWASDHTEAERPKLAHRRISWGESLYCVLTADVVSDSERAWILGRSLRNILDWHPNGGGR